MQRNRFFVIALTFATATTASVQSFSAGVDSLTGLAIYPGASAPDKLPRPQHYCGKQMDMSFTVGLNGAKVNAVVAWYQTNLPGATHVQAKPDGRSQDTFFMPDRSRQVTITGTPGGDAVYSISYGRFAVPLTPKEAASFNTGNAKCGA